MSIIETVNGPSDTEYLWNLDVVLLRHVHHVFKVCGYKKQLTAKKLGISRRTLDRYLKKLEAQ